MDLKAIMESLKSILREKGSQHSKLNARDATLGAWNLCPHLPSVTRLINTQMLEGTIQGLDVSLHRIQRGATSGCQLRVLIEKCVTRLLTFEDSTMLQPVVKEIPPGGPATLLGGYFQYRFYAEGYSSRHGDLMFSAAEGMLLLCEIYCIYVSNFAW